MATLVTDDEIIAVLRDGSHGKLTAYVASILRHQKGRPVETSWTLRQLKRLERVGKVQRISSRTYRTQFLWAAVVP